MFTPTPLNLSCIHDDSHLLRIDVIAATIVHFNIEGTTKTIALRKEDILKLAEHVIELIDYME